MQPDSQSQPQSIANSNADVARPVRPSGSDLKPGYKTTEFWITVFVIVIAAMEASAELLPAKWAAIISGSLAVIYKLIRLALKSQQALGIDLSPLKDPLKDVLPSEYEITPRAPVAEPDLTNTNTTQTAGPERGKGPRSGAAGTVLAIIAGLALTGCAPAREFFGSATGSLTYSRGPVSVGISSDGKTISRTYRLRDGKNVIEIQRSNNTTRAQLRQPKEDGLRK